MNRRDNLALLPILAGLAATPAMAQRRGPHGGLLAGSAGHEVELVAETTNVRIYLIDHGRVAAPRAGDTARLAIQEGQANRTVNLAASGDAFVAALDTPIVAGARVVVSGRMPDGHTVQGRFVMP
ncbi:hypothetical protein [Siccirubricoccus deserti]|uniref:DUF5666 domain-containing protein n=1 Tax=Siccirubricoccus deserti TaxID=2013562 RepID=A0A9X0R385_9PROT|nr:hypothetical protein [Siccirubricoccus deserti]MBC4019026.1 hypothetical protein [Siccirubricoccus deserti]